MGKIIEPPDMEIEDNGDLRKYYMQLPNMIDEIGLSVYALRLYVHLKRVTGDTGKCWQSTATLARICKMSVGMVSKARKELKTHNLINVARPKNPNGGKAFMVITITDLWDRNKAWQAMNHYPATSPHELASSPGEVASSPGERTTSPGELKNNPIKNNPIKNNRDEVESIEIPACLESSSFRKTWLEWLSYRAEIKHKASPTTQKKQLAFLSRFTPEIAAAVLDQSMTHGWQGIFELRNGARQAHDAPLPTETPEAIAARRAAFQAAPRAKGLEVSRHGENGRGN